MSNHSPRVLDKSLDALIQTELCIVEFLVGENDHVVTKQEVEQALRMTTISAEHFEIFFELLQKKLKRCTYDWARSLKVLIMLHYLQKNEMLCEESKVISLFQNICDKCICPQVQRYAMYLMHTQTCGFSHSNSAVDFMNLYPTMARTVELLLPCKLQTVSNVYDSGLVEAVIERLLTDCFSCYNSLRKGMDFLSDAVFDMDFAPYEDAVSMSGDALKLTMKLTQFFAHAFDVFDYVHMDQPRNDAFLPSTSRGSPIDGVDMHASRIVDEDEHLSVSALNKSLSSFKIDLVESIATKEDIVDVKSALQKDIMDVKSALQTNISHMNNMLQHDHGRQEANMYGQAIRDAERKFWSITDAQACKINIKLDKLNRHVGVFHEKLCRALLGRNIKHLVRHCNASEGFKESDARMSRLFTCIQDICDHLQLRPRECRCVRESLVHDLRSDTIGQHVLSSFITTLVRGLGKRFSQDESKWPKFASTIQKHCEDVLELLFKPLAIHEVIEKLRNVKELGEANLKEEEPVLNLCKHVDELIILAQVSEGSLSTRIQDVLKERWGLLVVFWTLKRGFCNAEVEIDLLGSVAREWGSWEICLGEIKTSDGIAMEKAQKQMNLVHEVFEHILSKTAFPTKLEYECKVTKCLFTVQSTQTTVPLIDQDGDFVKIDVSQLPY